MQVDAVYVLIMAASIVTGFVIAQWTQVTLPLAPREKFLIGLGAFCGAMIGAKLPFVLSDWENFLSGAAWFSNGKTILCGLAGGYFGVELAKWALDVRVKTGDSFAVPVAAAVGIGRLGCFYAGCCYGTPTNLPWGVKFTHVDSLPRHPAQLYEAAFHLTAAAALYWLERRGLFRGQLIKLYIISYAGYRFLTEYIRPEARNFGGMTGYQWAALVLAALIAWLWIRDARVGIGRQVFVEPIDQRG
jgi:phosphatidylglycerol:prolipoprotein diacylglycerol transferase